MHSFSSIFASLDLDSAILTLSRPALQSNSSALDSVRVGDQLVITTNARNNNELNDQPAVFIVEVRDKEGTTVSLDWVSGTVEKGNSTQVGVLWVPEHAGAHEMRSFAISGFENPLILSSISSQNVTIGSVRATLPLIAGNRTFDVQYSFSAADGSIQSMKLNLSNPSIVAVVDVREPTEFQIILPWKLLERMEAESGYHYCVGNDFVVFLNDVSVESNFRDAGDAYVLTVHLSKGSNELEMIGEDLLEYVPTCLTVGIGHYLFAKDLPSVQIDTWEKALVISRDYLDNLAQAGGEEAGTTRGGPIGAIELLYLHNNGKAFELNRYDGSIEGVSPHFNQTPRDSYYWVVTLNYDQDADRMEYTFIVDAQTGEVKDLIAS